MTTKDPIKIEGQRVRHNNSRKEKRAVKRKEREEREREELKRTLANELARQEEEKKEEAKREARLERNRLKEKERRQKKKEEIIALRMMENEMQDTVAPLRPVTPVRQAAGLLATPQHQVIPNFAALTL
jgi:hypothetical protein